MLIILCPLGGKNKAGTAARKQMKGTNAKCKRLGLHGKRVGYTHYPVP